MTWKQDEAACYGIDCDKHATCARYQAVDGNTNEHQVWIAYCADYSGYIPIKKAPEGAEK